MRRASYIAIMLIMSAAGLSAQSPTTTYPYLYDTFTDGTVVLTDGTKEQRQMNVHLRAGRLHYIDKGVVKEAFLTDVAAVEIGKDVFIPVQASVMKVVAKNDAGCVVLESIGDFDGSMEATGAYGVSSTSSATMKLTSIQTDSQVNQNYMNILNEKEKGVILNVDTKLYVVTPTYKVRATKKDVEASLPADKAAQFKAFLKANKVKWNNPQSLLSVVSFLSE